MTDDQVIAAASSLWPNNCVRPYMTNGGLSLHLSVGNGVSYRLSRTHVTGEWGLPDQAASFETWGPVKKSGRPTTPEWVPLVFEVLDAINGTPGKHAWWDR